MERQVVYEGSAAIEQAIKSPQWSLWRRSTLFEAGRKLTIEEAIKLCDRNMEGLVYARPN